MTVLDEVTRTFSPWVQRLPPGFQKDGGQIVERRLVFEELSRFVRDRALQKCG